MGHLGNTVSDRKGTETLMGDVRETLSRDAARGSAASEGLEISRETRALYCDSTLSAPLWISPGGLESKLRDLVDALEALEKDGLRRRSRNFIRLRGLLDGARGGEAEDLARVEILATEEFLSAGEALRTGRLGPQGMADDRGLVEEGWDRSRLVTRLLAGEPPTEIFRSLRPDLPWYSPTRMALTRYRAIARSGGWDSVVVGEGELLRPGDSGPQVRALRQRFVSGPNETEAGLAEAGPDASRYDDDLEVAVLRFQERHGLKPDGIVGRETLVALNTPVEDRVSELEISLERMRWLPDSDPRYVFVNVAGFQLHVIEGNRQVLSMDTQVGRPSWPTAIFSDTLEYLVINPYWHVPESIEAEETLPAAREDPGYLEEQRMVVVSAEDNLGEPISTDTVPWDSLDEGDFTERYDFRQEPGSHNALGTIKFMFPNQHLIYLHDTPAQGLFDTTDRATSHGCIRVEDPTALAAYLLGRKEVVAFEDALSALDPDRPTQMELPEPIPVHIFYLTTWAEPNGTVHFRPDIYGLNGAVARKLEGEHEG